MGILLGFFGDTLGILWGFFWDSLEILGGFLSIEELGVVFEGSLGGERFKWKTAEDM